MQVCQRCLLRGVPKDTFPLLSWTSLSYKGSPSARDNSLLILHRSIESHAAAGTQYSPHKLDFTNTSLAYGNKSTGELLRAWLVFRLCGFTPFVQNADRLLSASRKVLGDKATFFFVRHTFFNHFCAGEDRGQVQARMEELKKSNVGAILDYAAEDIPFSGAEDAKASRGEGASSSSESKIQVVARQYDYSSEAQSDSHAKAFLEAIKAAASIRTSPGAPSFASVKLTALGNPVLLERTSTAINVVRALFDDFDQNKDGFMDCAEFKEGFKKIFPQAAVEEMKAIYKGLDPEGTNCIDYVAWCQRLRLEDMPDMAARILKSLRENQVHTGIDLRTRLSTIILNAEEIKLLDAIRRRLTMLAQAAAENQVKLLLDAEHTFYQPAINHLALELSRMHNGKGAVIYNTYQAYLKGTHKGLTDDLERAKRQGYVLGVKLVRGAYVKLERQRALELNIESPVCDSIESTHSNYNKCMKMLLAKVSEGRAELVVASHNQRSVEIAVEEMGKSQLNPMSSPVAFGTLMGMADHLTQVLGLAGYRAFKLVPYGRIDQTIPYLLRRVTENSDVLKGAKLDLQLIQAELIRRMKGGPGSGSKQAEHKAQ